LRIPHVVVCVNKMDLVDHDEAAFGTIVEELTDWTARLGLPDVTFIPISALHGDNVVERSLGMPWYDGPSLLYHLEHVVIAPARNLANLRFPVQCVIRPSSAEYHDYRGYAGQLVGGVLRPGDEVLVVPGGQRTRVAAIDTFDGERECAFPTMSVTVRLEDQLDVSRGDMIVAAEDPPISCRDVDAMVCWMTDAPLRVDGRYAIKHTTRSARAIVSEIEHRVDVDTLAHQPASALTLNEIGRVRLRTSAPLIIDSYAHNRATGSFILIDEATGDTVGAGMVAAAR
jgi:sulfate adenylyltransferase subunit 1 (EFTu-like GTPase family)